MGVRAPASAAGNRAKARVTDDVAARSARRKERAERAEHADEEQRRRARTDGAANRDERDLRVIRAQLCGSHSSPVPASMAAFRHAPRALDPDHLARPCRRSSRGNVDSVKAALLGMCSRIGRTGRPDRRWRRAGVACRAELPAPISAPVRTAHRHDDGPSNTRAVVQAMRQGRPAHLRRHAFRGDGRWGYRLTFTSAPGRSRDGRS